MSASKVSLTSRAAGNERDVHIALAELTARQDSVDSDLQDVRHAVVNLGKRIDEMGSSINAKIDQRSQPQWQTYIAGAMLVGGLFFAFIAPIQHTQDDLRGAILKIDGEHRSFEKEVATTLNTRNGLFVSIREHDEFKKRIDEKIDRSVMQLDMMEMILLKLIETKR